MDDIYESGGPLSGSSTEERHMTDGGGRRSHAAHCHRWRSAYILFDTDSVWAEVRVAPGAALWMWQRATFWPAFDCPLTGLVDTTFRPDNCRRRAACTHALLPAPAHGPTAPPPCSAPTGAWRRRYSCAAQRRHRRAAL